MNTRISTVGMNAPPPPRRMSSAAVAANPAVVPASLPPSRIAAARDRAQSWRGKYLLALNICPQDIELARRQAVKPTQPSASGKGRLRAMSFHRSDFPDHNSISRSYSSSTEKEDEQRKSLERLTQQENAHGRFHPQQHHIQAVPLRAPSTTVPAAVPEAPVASATNPYGFATRPGLARGRRCHTDPVVLEDRLSAPIQIPTALGMTNQLDGNMRHDSQRRRTSPMSARRPAVGPGISANSQVKLLSWEEPVAMLAAADAVSKGWNVPYANGMELGVRRGRGDVNQPRGDHMDEDDEEDDTDSHGGDIFAMDESDDEPAQNNSPEQPVSSGKSRRRYRTESMNIVTSGREKRTHLAFGGVDDDEEGRDQYDDHAIHRRRDLSQSFVPPHQMVDRRDCFSIGLRDEFKKRRPINHI